MDNPADISKYVVLYGGTLRVNVNTSKAKHFSDASRNSSSSTVSLSGNLIMNPQKIERIEDVVYNY